MATVQDYLSNSEWVKRISQMHDDTDVSKDGYVSNADFLQYVDNLAKDTNRPELIAKLQEAMLEWTSDIGLKEGVKADKQEFLKLMAATAISENARVKKGEMSVLYKLDNALLDVVDISHDGHIGLNEFKLVTKAFNYDEELSEAGFAALDKEKNGKIERKDFIEADFNFWFSLDTDPDIQGLL